MIYCFIKHCEPVADNYGCFVICAGAYHMNDILQYFNSLEHRPIDRLLFLAVPIFILWFIELGVPLVALTYKRNKGKHAIINFSFTLFHLIIHALLAVFVVLACDWCTRHQFGIVHWLNFPVWAIVVF